MKKYMSLFNQALKVTKTLLKRFWKTTRNELQIVTTKFLDRFDSQEQTAKVLIWDFFTGKGFARIIKLANWHNKQKTWLKSH